MKTWIATASFAVVCLFLSGCVALKPVPQQALNCVEVQATVGTAVGAATCIASNSSPQAIESCFLSLGGRIAFDVLQCTALAIWGDLKTAKQVAAANGVDPAVVQVNAAVYLQAKGTTISAAPTTASPSH